jgi:hypothetical protein
VAQSVSYRLYCKLSCSREGNQVTYIAKWEFLLLKVGNDVVICHLTFQFYNDYGDIIKTNLRKACDFNKVQTAKILVVNFQELQQEYWHRIERASETFLSIKIRLCITLETNILTFNINKSSIFASSLTIPLQLFFQIIKWMFMWLPDIYVTFPNTHSCRGPLLVKLLSICAEFIVNFIIVNFVYFIEILLISTIDMI